VAHVTGDESDVERAEREIAEAAERGECVNPRPPGQGPYREEHDVKLSRLDEREDGTLVATYVRRQFRFLLSDGDTVDVIAAGDDSDVRGALLAHLDELARRSTPARPDVTIMGVADLGPVGGP
jgi:hypothetical protein